MNPKFRKGTHPGLVMTKFLSGIVCNALDVDEEWLYDFMRGSEPLDEEIAEKLADYFDTSKEFWINLNQQHYKDAK